LRPTIPASAGPQRRKNVACRAGPSTTVARNNIKIEDMNMAKPEWWHYDDAHQCINMLCRGETPFMLVQTSKVIEMQFSRLTK
jgi:hypothetical protein